MPFRFHTDVPHPNADPEQEARDYIEAIRDALPSGIDPALVIINTLANSIDGQDENSSAALGAYWATLRMFRTEVRAAILTIAYVGKDKTKEVRGRSASIGTVDRVLFTDGDRDRKVGKITHEMAKDTPDYPTQFYNLVDCEASKVVKPITAAEYEANEKPVSAKADKWTALRRRPTGLMVKTNCMIAWTIAGIQTFF